MIERNGVWDLDELAAQVALALSSPGYAGAENGRVRDVPDVRAIRYYTTLGLIDRAAEWKGRTAIYSARHLHQIVAIKKLQARGMSLARIQETLVGISDDELARISGVGAPEPLAVLDAEMKREAPKAARAFWKKSAPEEERIIPAEAVSKRDRSKDAPSDAMGREEAERVGESPNVAKIEAEGRPKADPERKSPSAMTGLKLGRGAMLLFEASRAPESADLEAIAAAAAPLLAVLEKRGLLAAEARETPPANGGTTGEKR